MVEIKSVALSIARDLNLKGNTIGSVPAQPIDYLGHGLRPPKNKNKIEYNLWEKKNLNYKLIKSFGKCQKKKKNPYSFNIMTN